MMLFRLRSGRKPAKATWPLRFDSASDMAARDTVVLWLSPVHPVGIVFSEWALASPLAWAYLAPILEENNGFAIYLHFQGKQSRKNYL